MSFRGIAHIGFQVAPDGLQRVHIERSATRVFLEGIRDEITIPSSKRHEEQTVTILSSDGNRSLKQMHRHTGLGLLLSSDESYCHRMLLMYSLELAFGQLFFQSHVCLCLCTCLGLPLSSEKKLTSFCIHSKLNTISWILVQF